MKFIWVLIFPLFIDSAIHAQVITYGDFKSIIPYLQKEDFKTAFEKTSYLLKSTKNDTSNLRGIVTYMNIFSAAGMVSLGQMTHDDFSKNVNNFVGQYLVMPIHPCIDNSSDDFNCLTFVKRDGELQGMTTSANKKGTSILCFEYFQYAEKISPSDFIGKHIRCGGILKSFEINPNESKLWISRIEITDAFARVTEPR